MLCKILLLIGELYIMYTFLYTNTLLLLVLIVNTNVGWVVNEEVVVIEVTFEYYRSNDGGSSCKILLLPQYREYRVRHTTINHRGEERQRIKRVR